MHDYFLLLTSTIIDTFNKSPWSPHFQEPFRGVSVTQKDGRLFIIFDWMSGKSLDFVEMFIGFHSCLAGSYSCRSPHFLGKHQRFSLRSRKLWLHWYPTDFSRHFLRCSSKLGTLETSKAWLNLCRGDYFDLILMLLDTFSDSSQGWRKTQMPES